MNWHSANDLPKKEEEVLIEVEGFRNCHFIIGKYDGEFWWQHLPWLGGLMPSDGWCGLGNLKILRWAYIFE